MVKKALVTLSGLVLFTAMPAAAQTSNFSFFVTSTGSGRGADLGGLDGGDRLCQNLAYAVGFGDTDWHAYLSAMAMDGQPAVNARDRIGRGPWYNFRGVLVARDVTDLHSERGNLNAETVINERGGRPQRHDILTGSNLDGTVYTGAGATACSNWTSSADGVGSARLGHYNREGGGQNPTSWNSAHDSRGCSQENLIGTGGDGLVYCFAAAGNVPPPLNEEG